MKWTKRHSPRWSVYALIVEGRVRYFGITSQSLAVRFAAHLATARRHKRTTKDLLLVESDGRSAIKLIAGNLERVNALCLERRLIRVFGTAFSLINYRRNTDRNFTKRIPSVVPKNTLASLISNFALAESTKCRLRRMQRLRLSSGPRFTLQIRDQVSGDSLTLNLHASPWPNLWLCEHGQFSSAKIGRAVTLMLGGGK